MPNRLSRLWAAPLFLLLIALAMSPPAAAQSQPTKSSSMPKVGDMAPDFKLNYFDGNDLKSISLDQYRGKKNVVLAFFIFAFTGG